MERKEKTNKLKLLASLFQHNFKGRQVTYIFLIDSNNEIKRARVPIKNGIPHIQKKLIWKDFSQT